MSHSMHSGCSRNFVGRKVEVVAGHSIHWSSEEVDESQEAVVWGGGK